MAAAMLYVLLLLLCVYRVAVGLLPALGFLVVASLHGRRVVAGLLGGSWVLAGRSGVTVGWLS